MFVGMILRSGKDTAVVSGVLIAAALVLRWAPSLSVVSNVLMIGAAVVAGLPIAAKALAAIRSRHVSIDLLVTVAAVGALTIGNYWEAAAVTFLFDIGGYLEARTMARTRRVISGLLDLAPLRAVVLRNGIQEVVEVAEVSVGETILAKPGSKVAVDGIVTAGESTIDESAITGESYPCTKKPGDEVYAGTFNQGGLLTVRVTGAGVDTTLARIIRRVEEAQESKAPTQRFIERFSRWYTPLIITLSLLVLAVTKNVEFALTMLVIGCPGALVLSTPVSVIAAIGGAARSGILMKGGAHLEESGRINAIAFDKTGTLTEGRPEVVDVKLLVEPDRVPFFEAEANTDSAPEHRAIRWAAVAESGSEHPLAAAILRKAKMLGSVPTPKTANALPGRGISATYSGKSILVGSSRLMRESNVCLSQTPCAASTALKTGAEVMVAVEGILIATVVVADPVRSDAAAAIRLLRHSGVREIAMLTGDNDRTAREVAGIVGITDVFSALMPEEKLEKIEEMQRRGLVVAMVGDGINDAPALAAANVGIAMGAAGTEIAIETADIALMRNDLMMLAEAIVRSKMAFRNIRQNVVIAVITVAGLLTGVLLGGIHMAGGMLIHEVSVMVVILNGMRLLRRRKHSSDFVEKPINRARSSGSTSAHGVPFGCENPTDDVA